MHCQFALGSTEEFCLFWPGLVDLSWAYQFVRSQLPDWLWIIWSKVAQVVGWFHLLLILLQARPGLLTWSAVQDSSKLTGNVQVLLRLSLELTK